MTKGTTLLRALHERGLSLVRELDYKPGIAQSLYELGLVAEAEANQTAARSLYEESLAIGRELGDKTGIARSLTALGVLSARNMEYTDARSMFEESLALTRELGDKQGVATVLSDLANVLNQQGHRADALKLRVESLELQRDLEDELGIVWNLELLAKAAMPRSKNGIGELAVAEHAARLWGATEALHTRLEFPVPMSQKEQQRFGGIITEFRFRLDSPILQKAWEEGATLSMEQAIDYALELAKGIYGR